MIGKQGQTRSLSSTTKAYVEMTKPRIIELLLITTIPAMVVAHRGWPGWSIVLWVLLGGTLSAGGANVINQVYDRDIDRIMHRTSGRPIPTGRVSPRAATVFGLALGVAGFVVLTLTSTLLAGILSLVAYGFYVLVYTMLLKRSTTQNIVIGGAAGAVPALIGWAAVTGDLSLAPWIMFAIIFYWTPPHFWALSIKYEEDYRAANIPMLSVVAGDEVTFRQIFWYSVVAVGVAVVLIPVAELGWIYVGTVVGLGGRLIVKAARLRSDRALAMPFFVFSNLYLGGVFIAMALDRIADTAFFGSVTLWLVIGSRLGGGGGILVLVSEISSDARAPHVSRFRQVLEVAITALFAFALLWASWLAVGNGVKFAWYNGASPF
ncbi:MAG: protoheme IX farnesyltransferase [Acidobacteria bacterium]|nr:MAG: protoheme IX farnesyltransferase [Acidobacteriota bacterium]